MDNFKLVLQFQFNNINRINKIVKKLINKWNNMKINYKFMNNISNNLKMI